MYVARVSAFRINLETPLLKEKVNLGIIVCWWTGQECVVDVTQAKFSLRARNRRVFSADGVGKPRRR